MGNKKLKQISVWLPLEFVANVENYIAVANQKADGIEKISKRSVTYNALNEYMQNNKL